MQKKPEDTWTYKVMSRLYALPDEIMTWIGGDGKMPFWLYASICITGAMGVALLYILATSAAH